MICKEVDTMCLVGLNEFFVENVMKSSLVFFKKQFWSQNSSRYCFYCRITWLRPCRLSIEKHSHTKIQTRSDEQIVVIIQQRDGNVCNTKRAHKNFIQTIVAFSLFYNSQFFKKNAIVRLILYDVVFRVMFSVLCSNVEKKKCLWKVVRISSNCKVNPHLVFCYVMHTFRQNCQNMANITYLFND